MNPPDAHARPSPVAGRWRTVPDPEVISAALAGDACGWEELVRRYRRLVFSVPRRYGFDEATSEDVFQEAFAILARRLADLQNREALPKWLITTTHRVCRGVLRRSRETFTIAPELLASSSPPEETVLAWERQHLVRTSLRRMGGRCEALLTALYLSQGPVSYESIARELNVPLGSIGPTRARCLAKLMAVIEAADPGHRL